MIRWFILVLLLLWQPLQAATLGFSLDNDFFTGKDSLYTNGVRLAWLSNSLADTSGCALVRGLCILPGISGAHYQQAWSVALQQIMITPTDIKRKTPDYSDMPYVGFSQLDVSVYGWNHNVLTGYGLRLGIIGKDSQAGRMQTEVHKLIHSTVPQGWDHQLGPATIGGIYAYQSRRLVNRKLSHGYRWAVDFAYGVDINNFVGAARAGIFVSYGHHALQHFLPDFTGLSTSGSIIVDSGAQYHRGWSVFTGLLGSYTGYNYIVRHAPPAYDLHLQRWPASFLIGTSYRWQTIQLIFTLRASSLKRENDNAPLSYGDLTLLWHY